MAAGKVCTGFSKPYVALYSESSGTISYTSGQQLARGVDVSIEPESADDNDFYADNIKAESAGKKFTGGTVTLTVDGLLVAAEKLIMGLPTPASGAEWIPYDDDQEVPYVGIGFIARYMSGGVESWAPVVLAKCMFNQVPLSAATQEEEIDWQTQELSASIYRGDDVKHTWKYVPAQDYATEALAEDALKSKLGIS